jgi:hypothetical protein
VTSATLKALTGAQEGFRKMFLQGFGLTFFTVGFVTGASAVLLRIEFTHTVTIAVFFGLLGGALLLIALSFVFFLFDLRASEATLRSANAQSEAVTRALIGRGEALDARIAKLEEAQGRAGVADVAS